MRKPKLSVIIPVYNADDYLERCVNSVLNQTEKEIEIILVDDGSSDTSGILCDMYAERDSRVKVIHQVNAGVSVARNIGIAEACGEYIGFVDADDWILQNMYAELLEQAVLSQAEIVMCDAYTAYSNGEKEIDTISELSRTVTLSRCEMPPELLIEMAGSAWRCIYKRQLIQEYQIKFPVGIKFSEDRIFNIYAMGYAQTVHYVKQAFYMRYINVNSVVHRFHSNYFELAKDATNGIKQAITDAWNDDESYQTEYLCQFIEGSLAAINNYFYKTSTLTLKQKKEMVRRVCNDIELHNALIRTNASGIRAKGILKKRVLVLCIYAKIANWKHKR